MVTVSEISNELNRTESYQWFNDNSSICVVDAFYSETYKHNNNLLVFPLVVELSIN